MSVPASPDIYRTANIPIPISSIGYLVYASLSYSKWYGHSLNPVAVNLKPHVQRAGSACSCLIIDVAVAITRNNEAPEYRHVIRDPFA